MSFERSYSIESHERIKLILTFAVVAHISHVDKSPVESISELNG